MCKAAFPTGLSETDALVVLIINIFAPGMGTLISACLGKASCSTVLVGLCQILTGPLLIGWIWAICWARNLRRSIKAGGTSPSRDLPTKAPQHAAS